jgi:hypothetical protein
VPLRAVRARDAVIRRLRRSDDRVDRGALGVARLGREQVEVQLALLPVHAAFMLLAVFRRRRMLHYTASTRIAVALNSDVPDFGSVASIVSTFVATRSGKCRFMNASPGRSVGS